MTRGPCHVSKHQDFAQFPPARDGGRDPRLRAVRKLSGFARPSKANQPVFDHAVEQVTQAARELLGSLVTSAPPRDREIETAKARAKAADRYRSSAAPPQR